MDACDFRMIEGCKVYSYEIACPSYPRGNASASVRRRTLREKHGTRRLRKSILGVLAILLLPFAFLLDTLAKAFTAVGAFCLRPVARLYRRAPGAAGAAGAASCVALLSALVLLL